MNRLQGSTIARMIQRVHLATAFVTACFAALCLMTGACTQSKMGQTQGGDVPTNEARTPERDAESIEQTLNALHSAASRADAATYWSLFADDAVFLGTDASERWTLAQFKAYATPFFEKGQGWTYSVLSRTISVRSSGDTAWFDERLMNQKYGECRGTGVLVRVNGSDLPLCEGFGGVVRWKIAQYNLSVPIPNDLLPEFAERIRASTSTGNQRQN